jgi:hypothetical protein
LLEMKELEVRHDVDGEVLQSRWRCSSAVGVIHGRRWRPVRLPVAGSVTLSIGLGLGQWVYGGSSEPRTVSPDLHLLFMALCDGSSPAIYGLGVPNPNTRSRSTPDRDVEHTCIVRSMVFVLEPPPEMCAVMLLPVGLRTCVINNHSRKEDGKAVKRNRRGGSEAHSVRLG